MWKKLFWFINENLLFIVSDISPSLTLKSMHIIGICVLVMNDLILSTSTYSALGTSKTTYTYTVIPAIGQVLRWRSYFEKDQTCLGNSISGAIEQLLNHLEKKYDR